MLFVGAPLEGDLNPRYANRMEAGPTQLEEFAAEARERFARVETRLDQMVTRAEFIEAVGAVRGEIGALRAEMYRGFTSMVKWIVGTAVVFGAAAVTVMTFVLNYAAPPRNPPAPLVQTVPAPQQAPPPPVIIQIPAYPAPPAR